ncbi:YqfQ family protein [Heyndrickxia acidicola]|uniref:YqfQ family protein n=1 Tax=Heyndrickxia acidicola TaxID=209389 RepID=A0ABU6ML77_9BACI|nr:YqfQ family protein [Heyndrickxia acidicola]MED1205113.1 YqfQ family protein [Heyndrickxia acidicola]
MPPGMFPPFSGQMRNGPMQMMGGMGRNPLQTMTGIARNPMQMMGGMSGNPMQAIGRLSSLRPGMSAGGTGANAAASGGRGLLSRLFQRGGTAAAGNVANAATGFQRAAGGGSLLRGLTNPGSINSFLSNTQNVLRTAQQFGPMVQQYGPLVRNLPSMWRMYRSLKNTSSDDETPVDQTDDSTQSEVSAAESQQVESADKTEAPVKNTVKKKTRSTNTSKKATVQKSTGNSSFTKGSSMPKLYV